MTGRQTYSLLGGCVDAMTVDDLMGFMAARVSAGQGAVVANHNLHSLRLLADDPAMRAFYATADRVEIDSMPLLMWGRLMGLPLSRAHRLTYLDWSERFWTEAAQRGWRVYHLGCAPGVGEDAMAAIRARHRGLKLAGRHGFFDMAGPENAEVAAAVAAFRPDILMVGMGMPRQERWILDNRGALPPCVILPIGGALAYEAGAVATPPRWTGRLGIEWLWRFTTEPDRLFHRYFLEPWALLPRFWDDVRRYRLRAGSADRRAADLSVAPRA